MRQISFSSSPKNIREKSQAEQQYLLHRLSKNKREVQERLTQNLRKQNQRYFDKLQSTDIRRDDNPQSRAQRGHFNSYYTSKKQLERVKKCNFTMHQRLMNMSAEVPTLEDCKKQSKRHKKLENKLRKLPSIFQYEIEFKKRLSNSKRYERKSGSVTSAYNGRKVQSKSFRQASTQLIPKISQNEHQMPIDIIKKHIQELKVHTNDKKE